MKFFKKYLLLFICLFFVTFFIKPGITMLLLVGIVLESIIRSIILMKKLQQRGVECIGKIIRYESDSEGHKTPFVTFTSLQGEIIAGKPTISATTDLSKIMSYKGVTDKPVLLIYDPVDPEKFILKEDVGTNYLAMIFIFLVGGVFVTLVYVILLGLFKGNCYKQ